MPSRLLLRAVALMWAWASCLLLNAMGLDFVPLLSEQYDLVIPSEHYESERVQFVLSLIRGDSFRAEVNALGGYETATMGHVVAELD